MTDRVTREFDLQALLPAAYYCVDCAERLCSAVRGIEGIVSTTCDKATGRLSVSYNPARLDEQALEQHVVRMGLEVVGAVEHTAYRLTGLD